ncbi:MAG: MBL fold metallo-hydrolase [Peptococcaceae bacterium]|jgi:flavorubredoxin|nr:MBL fold metallo-hydrolase [Peptococcaceae bacterium]
MENKELDFYDSIEIAEGIYWVGFFDDKASLRCNPYLVVDGSEAVLIDSGSRNDFSTVMLKIMRTGTDPRNIKRLIYHHYDPDLCGNIPHMEALIDNDELRLISQKENNIFISYYSAKSAIDCIEDLGYSYTFTSGRKLQFILTPFAHSPGSFVTYDTKTRVLFSSDLYGSYNTDLKVYSSVFEKCSYCTPERLCPETSCQCEILGIWDFHKRVMSSTEALRYALKQIKRLDVSLIAPQHGNIFHTAMSCEIVTERLASLTGVGIDRFLKKEGVG